MSAAIASSTDQKYAEALSGFASVAGIPMLGKTDKPHPGTIETYRRMRHNPTIALGRAVANAPITAADWSFTEGDAAPEGALDFVTLKFKPLIEQYVRDALFAIDYGWQAFEVVWGVQPNGEPLLYPTKLKALAAELTSIVLDQFGTPVAVDNDGIEIQWNYAMWIRNGGEPGDWYGDPRPENCREEWLEWRKTRTRMGNYATLAGAPVPLLRYPPGVSKNAQGSETNNFLLAVSLLREMGTGKGVAVPDQLAAWAHDLVARGADPSKFRAWEMDFWQSGGVYGADFVAMLAHLEKLMLRGWLTPERAATEGQFGTKAEAESHGDIVLAVGDEVLKYFRAPLQEQVDRCLIMNWGIEAKGTVRCEPAPLNDDQKRAVRGLVKAILEAPSNVGLVMQILDLDAMIDQVGYPKLEDDISDIVAGDVERRNAQAEAMRAAFGDPKADQRGEKGKDAPKDAKDEMTKAAMAIYGGLARQLH